MNDVSNALVPALLLLPIIDWVATILLIWVARRADPRSSSLTERSFQAVIVSLSMTAFALIFLNTTSGGVLFNNDTAKLIGRVAGLILGLAPIAWLYWYLRST